MGIYICITINFYEKNSTLGVNSGISVVVGGVDIISALFYILSLFGKKICVFLIK